jgi:pSer/pThr/pTyr-binding forkhead associated (FHA) protein
MDAPPVRPYSEPTPALGAAAIQAPPGSDDAPAASDAPTQYHQTASYKKDEVIGVLVAIDGELKGQLFPLFDGENTLGRAQSCDIVLSSKWISREHAMVVHQEGVFAIVPLTEKNRTYVNDREVDGAELSDTNTLRLGRTTFRFRSIEGA